MPFAFGFPLVGVGRMCRRHVDGEYGILHVLDVLDRAFSGSETRFHLFGLKSEGMNAERTHPRVASCDSQAYGVAARQEALKLRCGKPDTLVAGVMERWFEQQCAWVSKDFPSRSPATWQPRLTCPAASLLEARVAYAMEDLRTLHEAGEIEWSALSPLMAYHRALLEDDSDCHDAGSLAV